MRDFSVTIWLLVLGCMLSPATADEIDFNRDIRPILSNKCLLCHGPDPDALEAGLRLDQRDSAVSELDSEAVAVVPGSPQESELIARITAEDEDYRMPPADHGAPLTAAEIDLLQRWIQQGAKYATHWAYASPVRPSVPQASPQDQDWPRSPIDAFTLRRMQDHGLSPSEEADRYALARRGFLASIPATMAVRW